MADYPICYETIGSVALVTGPRASAFTRLVVDRTSSRLSRLGVDAYPFPASSVPDVRRLSARAIQDDYDAIVVVGDDALFHEALQELATTGIPMGYIPTVRGSDVARHFRLPFYPESAAEVIYEGFTTVSDVGKTTDSAGSIRYFISGVCAGLDIGGTADTALSWIPSALYPSRLRTLAKSWRIKPEQVRIEFTGLDEIPYLNEDARATRMARDSQSLIGGDGTLVLDRAISLVAFGNTRSHSGLMMCPRADHHDGLLDVTVIEKANSLSVFRAMKEFYDVGQHMDYDFVSAYRCKKATLSVESGSSIPALSVDSEQSVLLPVTIEAVEDAVRIIVPAP